MLAGTRLRSSQANQLDFSDFLSKLFDDMVTYESAMVPIELLAEDVLRTAHQHAGNHVFEGVTNLDRLMSYGKWLWLTHGIRQFLLLGSSEKLMEWRQTRT